MAISLPSGISAESESRLCEKSLEVLLHRLGKPAGSIRHAAQSDKADCHDEAFLTR